MPRKLNEHVTPAQRVINLFGLLLFTQREYTLTELSRELGCSKQTAARAVEAIERSFATRIETGMDGREKWYRMARPRKKPQCTLSPEEVRHLHLCRDMVRHLLPEDMNRQIENTVRQTTQLLRDMGDSTEALADLAGVLVKGAIDYTPHHDTIRTILEAIHQRRVLKAGYRPLGAEKPKTYFFAPVQLRAYREALYAEGSEVDCRDPKTRIRSLALPVHRFCGVEPTRLTFDHDMGHLNSDCFGFPEVEPFQVRARFDAYAARYVSERRWSGDQEIEPTGDGGCEITFTSRSESEVVAWILGFGKRGELLEPQRLRNEVAAQVAELARRYGHPEGGC
jgi:predicted DNA-binding transcriptional regulator YafY